ncbi:MAG: penicillin acylase family protein, partial [Bryobacteraceae bacterium]
DLYVESLDPSNPDRYRHRGAWRDVEIERQTLRVKGRRDPQPIELRYTVHGPILHEDRARRRAYALKWVGGEPGTAGYLAGLALARARSWTEFSGAVERYKVPSENLVYADTAGNIGWWASGMTPIRKNWSGLFPVPGEGDYEWSGFRSPRELPHVYNPPRHYIATANHNILPPGYTAPLGYEWAAPFRFERVREMLEAGGKFTVADFERMQQDVVSMPARRFQNILRKWQPRAARSRSIVDRLLRWDGAMTAASVEATIFAVWISRLPVAMFGTELGARVPLPALLAAEIRPQALEDSLDRTLAMLEQRLGRDVEQWQWGRVHQIHFRHPLGAAELNRGPYARPGDANTVNAASGAAFRQTNGASYRHILDLADWDRSVMTNVPGESGDPASPHYSDLISDWAAGKYHPLPFSRKAVEAATAERILLRPAP